MSPEKQIPQSMDVTDSGERPIIEEGATEGVANFAESQITSEKNYEDEILTYLEGHVFPGLSVTEADRHKALENAAKEVKTPEELAAIDRSFGNIRDSIHIGLLAYCTETKQDPSPEAAKEYLEKVLLHAERNSTNARIAYTLDTEGVIDSVRAGSFKGLTSLSPDARDKLIERRRHNGWSKQYRGGAKLYIEGRRKIEAGLGYSGGVVYGELVIGQVVNLRSGYGNVTLEIDPRRLDHLMFCEGDSLQINAGGGVLANKKNEGLTEMEENTEKVIASAKKRIITFEHAMISRAITDVLDSARALMTDGDEAYIPGGFQGYLEAHIIGELPVGSDAITSVVLSDSRDGSTCYRQLYREIGSNGIFSKIRFASKH